MKKGVLLVIVLAIAGVIAYFVLHKSPSPVAAGSKDLPLNISANSSAFTRSFALILADYYSLSDAFVAGDSVAIRKEADTLGARVDTLSLGLLKADTAVIQTAASLTQSMKADLTGLNGEATMDQKRRELNMVTDQLFSLIRVVRYNGSVVYYMRCPAAFADSSEGYWLSPGPRVENPYFGRNHPAYKDKALHYGEISDSIHFSPTP